MIIKTNFTNNGVPTNGLTPLIRIINLPGQEVEVSGASMTANNEMTGSYYYNFTTYSPTGNYDIRCDGGVSLSNYDRYAWAVNSDDLEIAPEWSGISGAVAATKVDLDSPTQYMANVTGINDLSGYIAPIQVETTAIKAKTDNLPADMSGEIAIVQGLLHSNIYTVPGWTDDDMTTSLIKIYDNKANAVTHGAGGLLATFSMTGTYSAGKAQTILMVRES